MRAAATVSVFLACSALSLCLLIAMPRPSAAADVTVGTYTVQSPYEAFSTNRAGSSVLNVVVVIDKAGVNSGNYQSVTITVGSMPCAVVAQQAGSTSFTLTCQIAKSDDWCGVQPVTVKQIIDQDNINYPACADVAGSVHCAIEFGDRASNDGRTLGFKGDACPNLVQPSCSEHSSAAYYPSSAVNNAGFVQSPYFVVPGLKSDDVQQAVSSSTSPTTTVDVSLQSIDKASGVTPGQKATFDLRHCFATPQGSMACRAFAQLPSPRPSRYPFDSVINIGQDPVIIGRTSRSECRPSFPSIGEFVESISQGEYCDSYFESQYVQREAEYKFCVPAPKIHAIETTKLTQFSEELSFVLSDIGPFVPSHIPYSSAIKAKVGGISCDVTDVQLLGADTQGRNLTRVRCTPPSGCGLQTLTVSVSDIGVKCHNSSACDLQFYGFDEAQQQEFKCRSTVTSISVIQKGVAQFIDRTQYSGTPQKANVVVNITGTHTDGGISQADFLKWASITYGSTDCTITEFKLRAAKYAPQLGSGYAFYVLAQCTIKDTCGVLPLIFTTPSASSVLVSHNQTMKTQCVVGGDDGQDAACKLHVGYTDTSPFRDLGCGGATVTSLVVQDKFGSQDGEFEIIAIAKNIDMTKAAYEAVASIGIDVQESNRNVVQLYCPTSSATIDVSAKFQATYTVKCTAMPTCDRHNVSLRLGTNLFETTPVACATNVQCNNVDFGGCGLREFASTGCSGVQSDISTLDTAGIFNAQQVNFGWYPGERMIRKPYIRTTLREVNASTISEYARGAIPRYFLVSDDSQAVVAVDISTCRLSDRAVPVFAYYCQALVRASSIGFSAAAKQDVRFVVSPGKIPVQIVMSAVLASTSCAPVSELGNIEYCSDYFAEFCDFDLSQITNPQVTFSGPTRLSDAGGDIIRIKGSFWHVSKGALDELQVSFGDFGPVTPSSTSITLSDPPEFDISVTAPAACSSVPLSFKLKGAQQPLNLQYVDGASNIVQFGVFDVTNPEAPVFNISTCGGQVITSVQPQQIDIESAQRTLTIKGVDFAVSSEQLSRATVFTGPYACPVTSTSIRLGTYIIECQAASIACDRQGVTIQLPAGSVSAATTVSACSQQPDCLVSFGLGDPFGTVPCGNSSDADGDALAPPKLTSVALGADALSITIDFAQSTNTGGNQLNSGFPCTKVLGGETLAKLPADVQCIWRTPSQLFVPLRVGPSSSPSLPNSGKVATIVPGDAVIIAPNTLQAVGGRSSFNEELSLPLTSRKVSVTPTLVIAGPTEVGPCSPIVLSPLSSFGNGGRPMQFQWALESATGVPSQLVAAIGTAAARADATLVVPKSLLAPSAVIVVNVTATNWLGARAVSQWSVSVLPQQAPSVSVVGGATQVVKPSENIQLQAVSSCTSCVSSAIDCTKVGASFNWTQIRDPADLPTSLRGTVQPTSVDLELDPRFARYQFLYVPKAKLTGGNTYCFRAAVSFRDLDSGSSSSSGTGDGSAFVCVRVELRSLVPIIQGGSRLVPVGKDLAINGGLSYDPEFRKASSSAQNDPSLLFSWQCFSLPAANVSQRVATVGSVWQPCFPGAPGWTNGNGPPSKLVPVPSNLLAPNTVYELTMTLSKDVRTATASVQFTTTTFADTPSVYILDPLSVIRGRGKHNPRAKLVISAVIGSSSVQRAGQLNVKRNYSIEWSVSNLDSSDSTKFGGPTTDTATLVIRPNVLEPGSRAVVQIDVRARDPVTGLPTGSTGSATIIVDVNTNPSGGSCSSSPRWGAPFDTKFVLSCQDWSDDDSPLQYRFEMVQGADDSAAVSEYGVATSTVFVLPPAPANRDSHTIRAFIRDTAGGVVTYDFEVYVNGTSSVALNSVASVTAYLENTVESTLSQAVREGDQRLFNVWWTAAIRLLSLQGTLVQSIVEDAHERVLLQGLNTESKASVSGTQPVLSRIQQQQQSLHNRIASMSHHERLSAYDGSYDSAMALQSSATEVAAAIRQRLLNAANDLSSLEIGSGAASVDSLTVLLEKLSHLVSVDTDQERQQIKSNLRVGAANAAQSLLDSILRVLDIERKEAAAPGEDADVVAATTGGLESCPDTAARFALNIIDQVIQASVVTDADNTTDREVMAGYFRRMTVAAPRLLGCNIIAGESESEITVGSMYLSTKRDFVDSFRGNRVVPQGTFQDKRYKNSGFTLPSNLQIKDSSGQDQDQLDYSLTIFSADVYNFKNDILRGQDLFDTYVNDGDFSSPTVSVSFLNSASQNSAAGAYDSELNVTGLAEPIEIEIAHAILTGRARPICRFWDVDAQEWSIEGCSVLSSVVSGDIQITTCGCTHLTDFQTATLTPSFQSLEPEDFSNFTISNLIDYPTTLIGVGIAFALYLVLLPFAKRLDRRFGKDRYKSRAVWGVMYKDITGQVQVIENGANLEWKAADPEDESSFSALPNDDGDQDQPESLEMVKIETEAQPGVTGESGAADADASSQDLLVAGSSFLDEVAPGGADNSGDMKVSSSAFMDAVNNAGNDSKENDGNADGAAGDNDAPALDDGDANGDGNKRGLFDPPQALDGEVVKTDMEMPLLIRRSWFKRVCLPQVRTRHLWASVALRHPRDRVNSVERLSCVLALVLGTMAITAIFYGTQESTGAEIVVAILSSLMVLPASILLVVLFRGSCNSIHSYGAQMDAKDRNRWCTCSRRGKTIGWVFFTLWCLICVFLALIYGLKFDLRDQEETYDEAVTGSSTTSLDFGFTVSQTLSVSARWLISAILANLQDIFINRPAVIAVRSALNM
jgi:REJ domain/GPCR proteolysis site, GPS, motif